MSKGSQTDIGRAIGFFVNQANGTKRAKERALESGATHRAERLEAVERYQWAAVKALRAMEKQEASG